MPPKTETDRIDFWYSFMPTRQRENQGKRQMVGLSAADHDRLSAHAARLRLSKVAMVSTLLNLADAIENGEVKL